MTWAVFSDDHRRAIEEIEASPSERMVAIVGVAVLDNTLNRTVQERLSKDADTARKLFKINGALGNTDPKIDLLWLLGGCERSVRNAMYGLAKIRNRFAHNLSINFDSTDEMMQEGFNLLTLHEGRSHYPHHILKQDSEIAIEPPKNKREVFLVNLKVCLLYLMRDRVSHQAHTNIPLSDEELRVRALGTKPITMSFTTSAAIGNFRST